MSTQLIQREASIANILEMPNVVEQLSGLLKNDSRKIQTFKTNILKMSMSDMLKGCTPESVIGCGIQALTLDLPLEAGQGYIVKYKAQAQLDIGFKGWQVLAKRDGYSVLADAVYDGDLFEQSGFGFDAVYTFQPNLENRQTADDKWVKDNIDGILVSIREDATGLLLKRYVTRDLLFKIMGMSKSASSAYSPYNAWAEQMLCAKAIKSVLSKMPIDISKAAMLNEAIGIANETEALQQQPPEREAYDQERFDTNWPKWVKLVEDGKQKAITIISQLTEGFSLSVDQLSQVLTLSEFEPKADIEGDIVDGEVLEPKVFDNEQFSAVFKEWQTEVENGRISSADMIESIHNTCDLTKVQLKSIESLHDCEPVKD